MCLGQNIDVFGTESLNNNLKLTKQSKKMLMEYLGKVKFIQDGSFLNVVS